MTKKIFVYGAGGHGKVVADAIIAGRESEFGGFVDDASDLIGVEVLGFPVLSRDAVYREAVSHQVAVALGIGDHGNRRKIVERCIARGLEIVTVIHPAAIVSPFASIGSGTVVMAGAVINPGARVGECAIINTGAMIEHDVRVGDYAHVSPNAAMGGEAALGAMSHLGLGAVVLPRVAIGSSTIVGAGAVVVTDIPDGVVAIGVPAKIHRRNNQAGGA